MKVLIVFATLLCSVMGHGVLKYYINAKGPLGCGEYTVQPDGSYFAAGCETISFPASNPCRYVPGVPAKVYPACCPQLRCPPGYNQKTGDPIQ